jgi:hypothetical protein
MAGFAVDARSMSSPPRSAAGTVAVVAAGVAAGLLAVALVRPWMPAVHQDEYLPIFPLAWYTKVPDARPSMLRYWSGSFADGRIVIPLRAYHYIGASKGLLWAAAGLPTEIGPYRATNGVGFAILVGVLAWAAWRFGGRRVLGVALAIAFLAGDLSFAVLGITDEGPILIHLLLATLLAVMFASLADRARWWLPLPIALVVALGIWDRLNFGWFVGAGLVACLAAAPFVRPWRRAVGMLVLAAVGTAAGLEPIRRFLPDYVQWARGGVSGGIPLTDGARLLEHATAMLRLVDPLAAYHRYANVGPQQFDLPWVAYRGAFVVLTIAAIVGCAVGGWRRRDPQRLFLAAFLAALVGVVVRTHEAWSSHHVVVVKPFVYVALGVLVGTATRGRARLAAGLGAVALAFAGLGMLGLVRLQSAPPVTGVYDVSWNATDAWRAAAASDVHRVFALDWGAYYPGVVNSRADQQWEMEDDLANPRALALLDHGKREPFGVLFRAGGPRRWIIAAAALGRHIEALRIERFDGHPGEPWMFMVLRPPATPAPSGDAPADPNNLVRNPAFRDGDLEWTLESFRQAGNDPEVLLAPCGTTGGQCVGLRLGAENDARLVQTIELPKDGVYEVRAVARAENVGTEARGVHVVVMDQNAETEDLRGTTEWQELRMFLTNPTAGATVKLGLRLGTYGSITHGTGWFGDVSVRPVDAGAPAAAPGVRAFTLTPK